MKYLSIFTLLAMLFVSCTNYKEDLLTDPNLCKTADMSFSADIAPILNNSCGTSDCHSAGGFAPGYLTNYMEIKTMVDNGKLLYRAGELRDMPPSGPLTDCQIEKIRSWIDAGAPNN